MGEKLSTENRTERLTQEEFLGKLYDKTLDWLKDSGSEVLISFQPQVVRNWDHHSGDPGPGVSFDLALQRGVFIRDPKKDFALVLGRGKRNKWDEAHLRLQFGFLPRHQNRKKPSIEDLSGFVSPHSLHHGHGEFYVDPRTNSVRIHCWADSRVYGGKDIGRRWNQEQLLSEEGLAGCFEVVKRTVSHAFDTDLT